MKVHSLKLLAMLLMICAASAYISPVSTAARMQVSPVASGQDGMLDEHMSPDDDGDGVQDLDDSHPNDPTRGTKPRPGPTDPYADDDGDGLPNVMDPDDNNNGIPDAVEGVSAGGRPPNPGPDRVPTPGRGSSASVRNDTPLVRALPSTGTGPGERASLVPALAAVSVFLLAASQLKRRTIRP